MLLIFHSIDNVILNVLQLFNLSTDVVHIKHRLHYSRQFCGAEKTHRLFSVVDAIIKSCFWATSYNKHLKRLSSFEAKLSFFVPFDLGKIQIG
jgi:hypothetical protein